MVGLLDALKRRADITAEVIYFRPGDPVRKWENSPGLLPFQIVSNAKRVPGIFNATSVVRAMKSVDADVWIVNSCYTAPETWAAIRRLNEGSVPWVYMNEAVRARKGFDSMKRYCLREILRGAAGIVGMGSGAEAQYVELLDNRLPSVSIPYYLDLSDFFELPPADIPNSDEPVRFLIVAQMIPRKGLDVLFEACKRLPGDRWALKIVGEGHLRQMWERRFIDRFGGSKVSFVGQVEFANRAKSFGNSHVFVFTSRWDGWGVAPIEAMAAGLPVISSDQVMSMREFIRDDENGYLVPSGDAAQFAKRMESFIVDPNRIAQMGQAARESLTDYTPEAGAEQLVRYITNLVRTARSAPHNVPVQSHG